MSGHNVAFKLFDSQEARDPGASGTVTVNRSPFVVPLVSAAAETRTLARPTRAGATCFLYLKTDGGDITLTVTGGYSEEGDTTFTFDDAGEFLLLLSCYDGTNYFWRRVADHTSASLGGVTATASEINQHCDESANTEVVTTTNVITAAESGKTFYLNLAAGFTSTLPAPAAGLRFRFIVKTAPTGAPYVITTNGGANVLYGMMLERAGTAGVAGAARDTFNFVHNQSIIGDWVEFWSDGTNFYYHGMVDVAAGNTVAAS